MDGEVTASDYSRWARRVAGTVLQCRPNAMNRKSLATLGWILTIFGILTLVCGACSATGSWVAGPGGGWDSGGSGWTGGSDSGGWDSGSSDSGGWDTGGGSDSGSWDSGGSDGGSWDSGGSDGGSW